MIAKLLDFTKRVGKFLKNQRNNVKPLSNKDASIGSLVTKADLYVSNLFSNMLKENFSHLNYIIIDEERVSKDNGKIFEKVASSEYQFVIDPIDGTLQFANNHPLYGVTIGVYKNARPLLGIIYLPELNQLTYFDGTKAYWVQNAFSKKEIKQELFPNTKPSVSIVFGHPWLWNINKNFSTSKALFLDYFAAVSQSFYTIIGKATAYCMYLNLWDIAGTIPIANYLGMKIYACESDKVYDKISSEYFNTDMSFKNLCILCYPCDYQKIRSMISPKKFDSYGKHLF